MMTRDHLSVVSFEIVDEFMLVQFFNHFGEEAGLSGEVKEAISLRAEFSIEFV